MNEPNLHPMNGLAMSSNNYFIEVIGADEDRMIAGPDEGADLLLFAAMMRLGQPLVYLLRYCAIRTVKLISTARACCSSVTKRG
jgi:hypothetical protein